MSGPRLAFIDWMKCGGMILIVLGHSGAQGYFHPSPPISFKQFGVAFFVFVMGYTLARETRGSCRVLWNRLFEVYLFGGLFAVLMSIIAWLSTGDLSESNYLPLALGVNVLYNYFPANPTTWYIGTYLHLLLGWAILWRRFEISPWMVVGVALLEIPIRALLMYATGDFVAYMLFTNWTSLLLLGMYCGKFRSPERNSAQAIPAGTLLAAAALLAMMILWPRLIEWTNLAEGFPFARLLSTSSATLSMLITSGAVSMLYLAVTGLTFRLTQAWPDFGVVRFFANNTLFVFIVHMPLIYALTPIYYPHVQNPLLRTGLNLTLFFVLPACVSEIACRLLRTDRLRDYFASFVEPKQLRTQANL